MMPYRKLEDLPGSVRGNLPHHAQEIYKEAFNSAYREYGPPREEVAHKIAWSAVKKVYRKDESTGEWVKSD